jgi:hypothetical protein
VVTSFSTVADPCQEDESLSDLFLDEAWTEDLEAADRWADDAWVDAEFAAIVEANFGGQPPEPAERPVPAFEPKPRHTARRWDVGRAQQPEPRARGVGGRKERAPPVS